MVNKRFQLPSLDDLAEQAVRQIPLEGLSFEGEEGRERLKTLIKRIGSWLLHELRWSLAKATEKAINEAAALIEDPGYYKTVKDRRQREKKRWEKSRAQQEEERLKHQVGALSDEEKEQRRAQIERERQYHVRSIAHLDEELLKLDNFEEWGNAVKM